MDKRKTLDDFEALVGPKSYGVILDILRTIGRDSRTERISVFIAGFLRYALEKASANPSEEGLSEALINLDEDLHSEDEEYCDIVLRLIDEICAEAKMQNFRTSARGIDYSVAQQALSEYCRWYNMPWEDW